MDKKLGFITKVIVFSAGISFLIKWGGPLLPINDTSAVALVIVLFPSFVLAGILGWRAIKLSS